MNKLGNEHIIDNFLRTYAYLNNIINRHEDNSYNEYFKLKIEDNDKENRKRDRAGNNQG